MEFNFGYIRKDKIRHLLTYTTFSHLNQLLLVWLNETIKGISQNDVPFLFLQREPIA